MVKADYNNDGKQDYFLCNRARRNFERTEGGYDALMFGHGKKPKKSVVE